MITMDEPYNAELSYRDLTDPEYELADRIELVLEAEPERWFLPSEVARKLKADTAHVRPLLQWMVRSRNAECDRANMNAWARYRNR